MARGGQGGRPVGDEELLGSESEACVRWDDPWERGKVIRQVEGDRGQCD